MALNHLSGANLIGLSSSLSLLISEDLSADELGILSSFFCSLGDNLGLLAGTKAINEAKNNTKTDSSLDFSSSF